MLGLPSSVRYIDRSKRPKRVFAKREDGTLAELFQIYYVHSGQEQNASKADALRWYQDAGGDDYRP